jgi:hypothetical protein
MVIQTDKEGGKVIVDFCDMALKVGGKQNLGLVNQVLACLREIPPQGSAPVVQPVPPKKHTKPEPKKPAEVKNAG